MDVSKHMTIENILKVVLAISIGFLLYKVFFGKETYYNYEEDKSGYAYPMDYEMEDVVDEEEEELEDVVDEEEELEDVIDEEDDVYEYADDEEEAYDDSGDVEDNKDMEYDEDTVAEEINEEDMEYDEDIVEEEINEEDMEYDEDTVAEEINEEDMEDDEDNMDYLYASDVEGDLQENFTLYSNLVGVDNNFS